MELLRRELIPGSGDAATAALAQGVPGVLAVEESIVFDEDLEREVTAAFRCDPSMANARIMVRAFLGRVDLYGRAAKPIGWRAMELASRDFIQVEPQATADQDSRLAPAA
jgi:hypothetical protein